MGNRACERFNWTLISMLWTLDPDQKSDWKCYISLLVHVYNCMKNDGTSFSLFYLMHGRHPRLPLDLTFGIWM